MGKIINKNYEHIKKMLVLIPSSLRVSGTPSSFVSELSFPLLNVKSVQLRSLTIPDTILNVFNSRTIDLSVKMAGNPVPFSISYTIPDGCYSLTNLLSLLQTEINLLSPSPFTITFDPNMLKVVFDSPGAEWFGLLGTLTTSVLPQLGFESVDVYTLLPGDLLTGVYSPSLNSLAVLLSIPELGCPHLTSNGNRFSFYVPVHTNSGEISFVSSGNSFEQTLRMTTSIDVSRLSINLTSAETGLPITLQSEWHLVLEVN